MTTTVWRQLLAHDRPGVLRRPSAGHAFPLGLIKSGRAFPALARGDSHRPESGLGRPYPEGESSNSRM